MMSNQCFRSSFPCNFSFLFVVHQPKGQPSPIMPTNVVSQALHADTPFLLKSRAEDSRSLTWAQYTLMVVMDLPSPTKKSNFQLVGQSWRLVETNENWTHIRPICWIEMERTRTIILDFGQPAHTPKSIYKTHTAMSQGLHTSKSHS